MHNNNPLSWRWHPEEKTIIETSHQLGSGKIYIPFATSSTASKDIQTSGLSQGYIVRGLTENSYFIPTHRYLLGMNGYILLHYHQNTKSVDALVKRAHRTVSISILDKNHIEHSLQEIRAHSSHNSKRALRSLFRTGHNNIDLCLAAIDRNSDQHIAILTLTQCTKTEWHIESMIRVKNAPNGTMESLISSAIQILRKRNYSILHLGEVPFKTLPSKIFIIPDTFFSKIVRTFSKELIKDFYDTESLFAFKNKFNPTWAPLYWGSNTKISIADFMEIARITGISELLYNSLLKKVGIKDKN